MNESCPCDTVKDLKAVVERHDRQLSFDRAQLTEIGRDLHYIKETLDKKGKMNMTVFSSVVQALCTLLLALIAARMGVMI